MANSTDKTDEQTSVTNSAAVDFSHRLADPNLSNSISLVNNIGLMTERANGVLQLLSWHFQRHNADRPSDTTFCIAIDTIMQELDDIKATVSAYCDADIAKERGQS